MQSSWLDEFSELDKKVFVDALRVEEQKPSLMET